MCGTAFTRQIDYIKTTPIPSAKEDVNGNSSTLAARHAVTPFPCKQGCALTQGCARKQDVATCPGHSDREGSTMQHRAAGL
jgi:hypothetical protein